MNKQQTVI